MTPTAARERFARDLAEARRMRAHREANGVDGQTAMVMTPIEVAEALLPLGADRGAGIGADMTPKNTCVVGIHPPASEQVALSSAAPCGGTL